MSCYSTNLIIWWWYKRAAPFFAPSGMTGLPVVADCLTNPIRWNKLFVQDVFSRSSTFRFLSSLIAIRACAIAIATTVFTMPPFFRIACWYFMTFSTISDLNRSGLTRLILWNLWGLVYTFFRWSRTVLSPTEYFCASREFPCMKAYLPIFSISSLVNVTYFLFWGCLRLKLKQFETSQQPPQCCPLISQLQKSKPVYNGPSIVIRLLTFVHLLQFFHIP